MFHPNTVDFFPRSRVGMPYFHHWADPWVSFDEELDQFPLLTGPQTTTESGVAVRQPQHQGLRTWTHHLAGMVKTEKKPNGDLVIRAQLPGVSRDDVKIDLIEDDNGLSVLTLRAEKNEEHRQTDKHGGSFVRNSQFQIMRTIPLGGKVTSDKIKADLDNDMLVIEVQCPTVTGQQKTSRIDIHQGTSKGQIKSSQQSENIGKQSKGQKMAEAMDEDMPKSGN